MSMRINHTSRTGHTGTPSFPTRRAGTLFFGAVLVALAAVLCWSCAARPDKKAFDNPFDPTAPDGGDPFAVLALPSGNNVTVTWTAPNIGGISAYEILHSLDGTTFSLPEGWEVPGTITVFVDTMPAPNALNYYKVRALDALGNASAASRVTAAAVLAPPYLTINGVATQTPTRYVTLAVRTVVGDSVHVAATRTFTDALSFPALAGDDPFTLAWDLGDAAANGIWKHVYLRVKTGGSLSPTAHDSIRTQFRPDLQVRGLPATVASRTLTVTITPHAGVARMRFASTRADLATAAWVAGADTLRDQFLTEVGQVQKIFGEFESDFGYTALDSVQVTPDGLAAATFRLAGGAPTTTTLTVPVNSTAVATQMRFSEIPDFTALPWQTYAATSDFELSAGAGLKVVYGQFRNDWHTSAVLVDTITYVPTR